MSKTSSHRYTLLATCLFLLHAFNPCSGSQADQNGEKLLDWIKYKEPKEIKQLLNQPIPFNLEVKDTSDSGIHTTCLHEAVMKGYEDIVHDLLTKGAKPNARDEEKSTPMHYAAAAGYTRIARLLHHNKATVDAKDKDDSTPLHEAARLGRHEMVKVLLQLKANKNLKNKQGKTPLDIAKSLSDGKKGKQETIQWLTADNIPPLEPMQIQPNITTSSTNQQNQNTDPPKPTQTNASNNLNQNTNASTSTSQQNQNITPPKPTQTNTSNNLNQNTNASTPTNQQNQNTDPPRPAQRNTDTIDELQDENEASLFTQERIIKGVIVIILLSGIGYILWSKSDTTHPTKSKKRKQKRTKAIRTATVK